MKKFTNLFNKLTINNLRNSAIELYERMVEGAEKLDQYCQDKYILNILSDLLLDASLVPCLIEDSIKGNYEVSKWNMFCIVLSLGYIISPLDFIPNGVGSKHIPFVGNVDELFASGGALYCFRMEMNKYREFLANAGIQPEAYTVYSNENFANDVAYQL